MSLPTDSSYVQLPTNIATGARLQAPAVGVLDREAPRLFTQSSVDPSAIYVQEQLGENAYPIGHNNISTEVPIEDSSFGSGIVILPTEGGGRGPTVAGGIEITTGMLLVKLGNALSENQFTPALVIRLNEFTAAINNHDNRLNVAESHISDSQYTIYQHGNAINTLNQNVTTHSSAIDYLTPLVNQHETDIGIITPVVTTHTGDIASLNSDVSSLSGQIASTLASTVQNAADIEDIDDATMILADSVNDSSDKVDNMEITVASNVALLANHTDHINNLNALLGGVGSSTDKRLTGYATNGETVTLDFLWEYRAPTVSLINSHGVSVVNPVTATQEIIYGHAGIIETANAYEYKFTISAAILEYAAPTVNVLTWQPADILAIFPPGTEAASTLSTEETTTGACMGLRIQCTLGLVNTVEAGVSANIYAQIAIDTPSGDDPVWINIAELYALFNEADGTWVDKTFDIQLALPQAVHTYQFRGLIVTDYAPFDTLELTGAIHVSKVTESGTGTILSNGLQIKWSAEV